MLAHALKAISCGFRIFPVVAGGKVPHPHAGRWGETATDDPNRVIEFWTRVDPNANYGIACKPSSLLVVDLDVAKEDWKLRGTEWAHLHAAYGPLVNGEDLFDEMRFKAEAFEDWDQDGYQVRTGSGGLHLYYRWPDHWPRISQASPVKGIVDVRGNGGQWGGYVLGEGCRTEAGEYTQEGDGHILLPPVWIRRLVAEKPPAPRIQRPPGLRPPRGPAAWSGLVDSVRNAGEGNRNNTLTWAVRTVCEEGGSEADALAVLGPPAADAGLPEREIQATVRSAFRTQSQKDGR